jgi:c-di-GMP phosphodiesterase
MSDIFVARQPIFDKDLNVYAYELLFRSGDSQDVAAIRNGQAATSTVIVNTFANMGLQDLVGGRPAAINVSQSFLVDALSLQLPAERLIIEVLEDVEVDRETVQAVQALRDRGYTIALDDFVYKPELEPLIQLSDLIKLDVHALGSQGLWQQMGLLQKYGKRLVAEKVETHEELDFCKSLGFDYYQGHFLCQPKLVTKRTVPTNRMAKLSLIAELNNPEADFDALEKIISRDVGLSYRFLRYINSAFFSLPHKVGSIRQALVLLGLSAVKNWATLLAMADIDDKPNELIVTALVRAKMCELASAARAGGVLHHRDVLGGGRAARLADGRGARLAAALRRDQGRAPSPPRSQGRGAQGRPQLRARELRRPPRPRASWRDRAGDLHVGHRLGPRGRPRARGGRCRTRAGRASRHAGRAAQALSLRPLEKRY